MSVCVCVCVYVCSHLKSQYSLSRVDKDTCLREYKVPRALPSHTSYPASDKMYARIKDNYNIVKDK